MGQSIFIRFRLLLFAVAVVVVLSGDSVRAQKPPAQCEQGNSVPRNWELIDKDYVYFDYVLCPANMSPAQPLVRVWITTQGNGFAVEKWADDRDGSDRLTFFQGKTKAYTLYRDLLAIPLTVFKAESRAQVPAEMSSEPFLSEGRNLVPLENLTPDSAERAEKAFGNADGIIGAAERRLALLFESSKIGVIVTALGTPFKQR